MFETRSLDRKALGAQVRHYREKRGFTQMQLAERADLTGTYIGYVERGEKTMSMESFVRIANALDVTPNELLSDSLSRADHSEDGEVNNLLGNCGDIEKRTLLAMLRAQEAIIINAMNDQFSSKYTVDLLS